MQRAVTASIEILDGHNALNGGFAAARALWNTTWWCAVGYNQRLRRQRGDFWRKIKYPPYPGKFTMQAEMQDFWAYKNLSDRCASYTVKDFDIAMRSWFSNLKSNPDARPPRPIKEGRTLTFEVGRNAKQVGEWTYRLTVLGGHIKERHCIVKVHIRPGVKMSFVKLIRITPELVRGRYQISLVGEKEFQALGGDSVAGLDLGIINLGALAFDSGDAILYSGRALLDILQHSEKRAAQCKPSGYAVSGWDRLPASKHKKAIQNKASNTIGLAVHNFTRHIVDECIARGVGLLVVGDLTGIREGKDFGSKTNQKLHRWPFRKIIDQLKYKAEEVGIEVKEVSEAYTSQTCCVCGCIRKANRIERGLYHCPDCGHVVNADINGAINILKKVSPEALSFGVGAIFPSPPSTDSESQDRTGNRQSDGSSSNLRVFYAKFDLRNYSIIIARNAGV